LVKHRTKVVVHCFPVMRKRRSGNKTGHYQSAEREQRQREATETKSLETKYTIKLACVNAVKPTGSTSSFGNNF